MTALKYYVSTGRLYVNNILAGVCYSGNGTGLNNPKLEADVGIGPIPVGTWSIGKPYDSDTLGPFVMNLDPVGFSAHGRSLFRMHGDNREVNHTGSHGCIVAARSIRQEVANCGATTLEVVA